MQRRDFQRQLSRNALALALAPWLQTVAPTSMAQTPRAWRHNPFALGVASGRPLYDAIILWTRLLIHEDDRLSVDNDAVTVTVEVFSDAELKRRVYVGEVTTHAQRGHAVHAPVRALQPDREYWYRFRQGNATSMVGHTRTLPGPNADTKSLRIALASCQHYEQGQYVAHQEIASQPLDFVLFVGDYIYESSNPQYAIRSHGSEEPKTLAQYRQRYELYKSDPALQAAHAAHPWVLMWDDHEVVNDYANDQDRRYTPPSEFLQRRAAAYQAYFEHQPLWLGPDAKQPADLRLYDQFVWGKLAEIWTLDCRQYRSPQACRDPLRGGGRMVMQCEELDSPERTMLGGVQERWFDQGFRRSTRTWKLLAQTTQISSSSVSTPVGRSTWNDAWDGYPEARRRLLQTIVDAKQSNVVTLGGDVHMNVAAQLRLQPNDANSPIVASEIVTTSITSRGMGEKVLAVIRDNNPDLLHARADERGYTLVQVTPEQVRCDFRTTAFPAGSAPGFKTQASFVVERGVAGIKPASS